MLYLPRGMLLALKSRLNASLLMTCLTLMKYFPCWGFYTEQLPHMWVRDFLLKYSSKCLSTSILRHKQGKKKGN